MICEVGHDDKMFFRGLEHNNVSFGASAIDAPFILTI